VTQSACATCWMPPGRRPNSGLGASGAIWKRDRVLALALMRSIEIIGEAASKVSPEVRTEHPDVPWSDIIGMRHRLIHAYFEIDLGRVCDTLATDLPPLIVQLEGSLSD
jgi:uncharacterized protein with HEPN domain